MAILFQLTMFTGELSDVFCCGGGGGTKGRDGVNTVGGSAQKALHHPVDHRDGEAVSLQQGGRWSCNAQEGFDLRPPTDLYCNNLKPEIPQRTWFSLDSNSFQPVLLFLNFLSVLPSRLEMCGIQQKVRAFSAFISFSLLHSPLLHPHPVWISSSFLVLSSPKSQPVSSSFCLYSAFFLLSDLPLFVSQTHSDKTPSAVF